MSIFGRDYDDSVCYYTYSDLKDIVNDEFTPYEYGPTIECHIFCNMLPTQGVWINYTQSTWEFEDLLSIKEKRNVKLYLLGLIEFSDISDSPKNDEVIERYIESLKK